MDFIATAILALVIILIGIVFALPLRSEILQSPRIKRRLIVFGLSFMAFASVLFTINYLNAFLKNPNICLENEFERVCYGSFGPEKSNLLTRELWLQSFIPPTQRMNLCFVEDYDVCKAAYGINYDETWSEYLFPFGLAAIAFASCYAAGWRFSRDVRKRKLGE